MPVKLPRLERAEPEIKRGRPTQTSKLHNAVSKRIMELDDDVRALKERREWAWLPAAEIRQYSRLIKLFEETIKELSEALV